MPKKFFKCTYCNVQEFDTEVDCEDHESICGPHQRMRKEGGKIIQNIIPALEAIEAKRYKVILKEMTERGEFTGFSIEFKYRI